jgi:hypothetical protein
LHYESVAFELLFKANNIGVTASAKLEADIWINLRDAQKYFVYESTMKIA